LILRKPPFMLRRKTETPLSQTRDGNAGTVSRPP
jgi:hypothetical protein